MTAWWIQQIVLARQERKKVRLLLRLENQRNIDALNIFWASVVHYLEPDISYSPAMLAFEKRRAFVVEPMPEWGHLMWTANAAKVANALHNETEISACYELHANLDKLTNLRQVLEVEFASLDPKGAWGFPATFERWKEDAMQGNQYTVGTAEGPAEQFRRRTQKWWDKIEQVRAAILTAGNPIAAVRQQGESEHNQRAD
jgi:hypothetical protein